MSKIMYKDKQILGCISDSKYVAYDNTGTGLSATNAQDAITELNGKLASIPVIYSSTATVAVANGKATLTHNLNITSNYNIQVMCISNLNIVLPYTSSANSVGLSFYDSDMLPISNGTRVINYIIFV